MSFTAEQARQVAASFELRQLPPEFFADPFPTYRALREHEPVKRCADGSVLLTRYADCEFVYKHPKLFSSDKQQEFGPKYGTTPLYDHHTTSLVFNDPPLHTRVRRLIIGALSPKAIALMQPGLEALVERLLDELPQHDEPDLIEHFAAAIPIEIIGNLLGVPVGERGPLREWSLAILGALEPVLTPAAHERGNRAVRQFLAYLEGLVARRRAEPGDPQRDVLTRLIQGEANPAEGGDGKGEHLSEAELLHNCIFLLNAGHETTTNLIGNGLVALQRFAAQRERLLAEPALIKTAVEEVLRYESSNQLGNRITTEAVEVGGVALAPRTPVTIAIGAANRDPAQFPDPETFDVGRTPNRHLAFGSGIHQCAGMGLARLEGEVALSRFIARFPNYRLVGEPVRGGRARFRGFLNVRCALG
jgi:cytochrome P450